LRRYEWDKVVHKKTILLATRSQDPRTKIQEPRSKKRKPKEENKEEKSAK